MLDKLPLELLDHVLDLLPRPSTREGAHERTDALLSCCLVSKRVYERSLPVLWRNIRLKSEAQASALLAVTAETAPQHLAASVRTLHIEDVEDEDEELSLPLKESLRFLELFTGLRSLRLDGAGIVSLKALATGLPSESSGSLSLFWPLTVSFLADLQNLHLAGTSVLPLAPATSFPCLHSLTLHSLVRIVTSLRAFPNHSDCRRLRTLAFSGEGNGEYERSLLRTISADLLDELEVLQLHGQNLPIIPTELLSACPTLLTFDTFDLAYDSVASSEIRHIRFWIRTVQREHPEAVHLQKLCTWVENTRSPRSLHLPISLHDEWGPDVDELAASLANLLATCARHLVDVLWYDPTEEENYALSRSFQRYVERLAA
jgi:hypothetical protein